MRRSHEIDNQGSIDEIFRLDKGEKTHETTSQSVGLSLRWKRLGPRTFSPSTSPFGVRLLPSHPTSTGVFPVLLRSTSWSKCAGAVGTEPGMRTGEAECLHGMKGAKTWFRRSQEEGLQGETSQRPSDLSI